MPAHFPFEFCRCLCASRNSATCCSVELKSFEINYIIDCDEKWENGRASFQFCSRNFR